MGATYVYGAQNRLTTAIVNGVTTEFTYDSRNRVVRRTSGNGTLNLTYSGWSLIEERNASGALEQVYVHGAGIDEILVKITPSGPAYYHHDGLGSTVALTGATGQLLESYRYDAFGAVTILSPSTTDPRPSTAFANRFLFTGREWLSQVGLYDYRNRVYSAELGRFLQTDPIRFSAGDGNLYRYVGNDPGNLWDPWGLAPGDCYPTRDAAAQDAMRDIYGPSTEKDREHGGELYKKPDGSFSYTKPRMGDQHSVAIRPKSPGYEGYYHSHGGESGPKYDDENFSKPDKQIAKDTGKPAYLVTPSGAMKKYDPANRGFLKNPTSSLGNVND